MSTSKSKSRIRYSPKFRQQIVDLVRAGCPIPELVQQFGCAAATIRNWLRLALRQDKRLVSPELTLNERAELEWLRRENRQLLRERESSSRSAAWLAPESRPSSKGSAET